MAQFRLKEIKGPIWDKVTQEEGERIFRSLTEFPLKGQAPEQYGFVKCQKLSPDGLRIFGYFTHQAELELHKYDEDKNEKRYKDSPFEDVLFILLLDQGLCLINSRRFKEKSLTMKKVFKNFESSLYVAFSNAQMPFKGMDDKKLFTKKEKFIEIFESQIIYDLEVEDLKNQKVPEDLKLYNPNFDKDEMAKNYLGEEFTTISSLEADTDGKSNLWDSTLAKAAIYTGKPVYIKFKDVTSNTIRKVKRELGPSFGLNIDIESPDKDNIEKATEELFSKHEIEDAGQGKLSDFSEK